MFHKYLSLILPNSVKTPTSQKLNYTKDFCVKSHKVISPNLDFSDINLCTRISAVQKSMNCKERGIMEIVLLRDFY